MNFYRIAIAGPAGAGKTTLAQALANELRLTLIPESIRVMASLMGLSQIRKLSGATRLMLQSGALAMQIERENVEGYFVSDRSTLDYLWYHQKFMIGAIDHARWMVFNRCRGYTHLFIVPAPEQRQDDGFRLQTPDADIVPFLHRLGPTNAQNNVHQLTTDGVENRLAECLRIIRGTE